MANLLTLLRLALVLPLALAMAREEWVLWAGVFLCLGVASDVLDGPIARRQGTAGPWGRAADHASDFFFVTGGLCGAAFRGAVPGLLPALIAAAFAQYVVDSYWLHRQRELRMSRLGRYNGILYFFPLFGDVLIRLGFSRLQPAMDLLVWALVASTVLSIADRLAAVRQPIRRAPDWPAGETADRSMR